MKLTQTFANLLLLSVATLALPVTEESTALAIIPEPAEAEQMTTDIAQFNSLVARDDCSTIGVLVDKIGTSAEIAAYFSSGYYSALYVCRRIKGENCNELARAIASIFVSIAFIAGRATGAYSLKREELSLAGYLDAAMNADGEVFDAIDDISHTLAVRDDKSTGIAREVASVRNWYYEGLPVSFDIHDFGDGNGHIVLPLEHVGSNSTNLAKRASGHAPGFKVSYTTRMESKLTRAHRIEMANALSSDWASRANRNDKLSNYMGLWKTDHKANFYFRIIPETVNFGLNYESVDVCGSMARWL
jgi:hypothetical protein